MNEVNQKSRDLGYRVDRGNTPLWGRGPPPSLDFRSTGSAQHLCLQDMHHLYIRNTTWRLVSNLKGLYVILILIFLPKVM